MLKWCASGLTDAGCERKSNEDTFFVSPDMRVFAVADGMGGVVGGAMASKITTEAIEKLWNEHPPHLNDRESIRNWLNDAVITANRLVWGAAEKDQSLKGMGTTVVIGVQSDDNLIQIAHVGDSRAYLLRGNEVNLVTKDHSVVQEMVASGRLTEEQARVNPYRNLITRCLGQQSQVEIDKNLVAVQNGDTIVLCSDGLPEVLRDDEILDVVRNIDNAESMCKMLIKRTVDGGAPDNVTVIVIHYFEKNGAN